jgi:S-methylmethionine-dependent homocysteine/selenocysteine methylase
MAAEVKVVDGGLATEIERKGFSIHVRIATENTQLC